MKILSSPSANAARNLMNAGDLARSDFEELGLHGFGGDDRLDRFGDLVEREAEAVGDHGDRFRQAVMLDDVRGDLRAKFFRRHSRADFFLQRQAALGGVHDAHGAGRFDALRDGGEHEHELVHHEAGIDARADQRDAFFFRVGVELRGKLRMLAKWVRELLAGRDDAAARGKALEEFVHHVRKIRGGRVDDDIHGL